VFTPFALVARHRNADADVESDAAIVNPTRVAMIKRFILALQKPCDSTASTQSGTHICSGGVAELQAPLLNLVEVAAVGIEWIVGFSGDQ
jgi:hypothetical protein